MKISIITVFPEIHSTLCNLSIIKRAVDNNLISFNIVKLSDLCDPKVRIDEPICGPGAGMVIKPEVIEKAITQCENQYGEGTKIFFSPQGIPLNQKRLHALAQQFFSDDAAPAPQKEKVSDSNKKHLILICSRYEGVDARVEKHYADLILSAGDYVLMGGDVPAQLFLEGILRLLPGVVGKQASVEEESFEGPFLDHPHYGLPVTWKGQEIPGIVRSGNHAAINEWRADQAAEQTVLKRFDWFREAEPTEQDLKRAQKYIPSHYVAIMHTQVVLKGGRVGETSIPSLDIHDVARACSTYGIKNFFIVSPLQDQQAIVGTFLKFWKSDRGKNYNQSRHIAISSIIQSFSYDKMIKKIEEIEGVKPLIITTSARKTEHKQQIDYFSQKRVWAHKRPVLFVFGTGHGLAPEVTQKSDYMLLPVNGMTKYNHLSVRSAVSIILDRWLGLQPKIE